MKASKQGGEPYRLLLSPPPLPFAALEFRISPGLAWGIAVGVVASALPAAASLSLANICCAPGRER